MKKRVKSKIFHYNFLKKNCKGELTTQQIVGLVILITSFAIVLFLLFRLNLGETTDKEICHNSVVMKGKTVMGGSLDCRTNYVCISGGGECQDFNPTVTKKIDLSKPNAKNETMKAIADEMADCWWMFGEGKIDYVGYSWKVDYLVGTHCAICSIVKFDSEIQKIDRITYEEFYNFLIKPKDKTQTYLKYLYEVSSVDKMNFQLENFDIKDEIDFNKKYTILTGMIEEEKYLPPYFIQTVSDTGCKHFDITKA